MEGAKGDTKSDDGLLVGEGAGVDDFSGHKAVQIVKINEDDHSFELDEEALDRILNNDKVKDKPVCVVSVAVAWSIPWSKPQTNLPEGPHVIMMFGLGIVGVGALGVASLLECAVAFKLAHAPVSNNVRCLDPIWA